MDPPSISPGILGLTVVGFLLLLGIAAFFSAAEAALAALPFGRLQQLAADGHGAAASLVQLTEQDGRFRATTKIGLTLAILVANALALWQFGRWLVPVLGYNQWAAVLSVAVVAGTLTLLLGQYVPRIVATRSAESWALACARPLRLFSWLLWPFRLILDSGAGLLLRPFGLSAEPQPAPAITEADLKLQLDAAEEGGVLAEVEHDMIDSIFDFSDTLVREIMVPRLDIVAAEVSQTSESVLDLALSAGHSRIPVYEEDVDHILGIFYVKDAVLSLRRPGATVELRLLLRPVHFVPETKKVDDLLREMRQSKAHMAIAVDEYGGTAGVVTIEDILEEIVGEIQDEFDPDEVPVDHINDLEAVVDALVTLHQVNEVLALHLAAEDVETLGGYVYGRLGRAPVMGDEIVEEDGLRLIVAAVDGNRIKKVRIRKVPPQTDSVAPSPEPAAPEEPPA